MTARRLNFSDVSLYAITPDGVEDAKILQAAEKMLAGGVDAIQLRSKSRTDRQLLALGKNLKALCRAANALFIVNDRPDLALFLEADGVHIGHENSPFPLVRSLVGHRMIVGVSSHTLPEAIQAQKNGADYVSCGPLWSTPTKPNYEAVGLKLIGLYRAALNVPFVAIGGIDETNLNEVVKAGAKTVAVVRALFESTDAKATASRFLDRIKAGVS